MGKRSIIGRSGETFPIPSQRSSDRQRPSSLPPSASSCVFSSPSFSPSSTEELNERSFSPPSSYLQQSFERQLCRAVCSWLRGPFFFHLLLLFYSPHPTSSCPSLHSHHAPLRLLFSHRGRISCSLPSIRNVCQVLLKPFFPRKSNAHFCTEIDGSVWGQKIPAKKVSAGFFCCVAFSPFSPSPRTVAPLLRRERKWVVERIGRHSLLKPITCPLCPHSKQGESLNGHPLSALFLGIRRGPSFGGPPPCLLPTI